MSVETYLKSIRQNTGEMSNRAGEIESTMKELLNFETLKKAVAGGMEKGSKKAFKRLEDLSQKILNSSYATHEEILEINQLLKIFYSYIQKDQNGNTQLTAESLVKALAEVLDEFGDKLPEKFQKRLRYDLVSAAEAGGANPQQVFQQLNVTQVNQQITLQNIYDFMVDRQAVIDREAEAKRPVENQEKRDKDTFWKTTLGKITGFLGDLVNKASTLAKWAGIIAVGMALWDQLKESLRNTLQGGANFFNLFRGGKGLLHLFSGGEGGSLLRGKLGSFVRDIAIIFKKDIAANFKDLMKMFSKTRLGGALGKAGGAIGKAGSALAGAGSALKTAGVNFLWTNKAMQPLLELLTSPALSKIGSMAGGMFKTIGKVGGLFVSLFKGPLGALAKGAGKLAGPVGLAITIISSLYDFMQGFINTQGTITDKIVGGLKNMIVKFVMSIWDLVKALPGLLWKAFIGLGKVLTTAWIKGLDWILKSIGTIFKGFANFFTKGKFLANMKSLFSGIGAALKNAIGGGLGSIMESMANGIENTDVIKNIWGMDKLVSWLHSQASKLGATKDAVYAAGEIPGMGNFSMPGIGSVGGQLTYDTGFNNTGITYTGNDAYQAMVNPLGGYASGALPPAEKFKGINAKKGVKMSAQAADFITRAGLTHTITSVMDGGSLHKSSAKNFHRTHASGNKFDYAGSFVRSASALAVELEKMLKTPGIKEIRTEAIANSVVEGARAILERKGYKTRGILFNDGFPKYATGPHLDVLIDPAYKGVKGTNKAAMATPTVSTKNIAAAEPVAAQANTNPLIAELSGNITKAYSEAIKMFQNGAKGPTQLAANSNAELIQRVQQNAASAKSTPSFTKKNDIDDANLAAMQLYNLNA